MDPLQIIEGDALERLREMPSESTQCMVTSPPYWGLRDYGIDGQMGLEASPWEFIDRMVELFREARRVLRPDGTMWMNMGDSYAHSGGAGIQGKTGARNERRHTQRTLLKADAFQGFKPKDLLGMPWRLAFALQEDGWWLRQDIIWSKPTPMPESVRDRCTKSHEYLFLLTKSATYYYDQEAIREPASPTRNMNSVDGWVKGPGSHHPIDHAKGPKGRDRTTTDATTTKNKRSVWNVYSQPFSDAHFATFPEALVLPCILAGTSARGRCPTCGAPWRRIVELGEPDREHQRACGGDQDGQYKGRSTKDYQGAKAQDASETKRRILEGMRHRNTVGWEPTCDCPEHEPVPCVVGDFFGGSGTTAKVAIENGRHAWMIELNPEYAEIARRRTQTQIGLPL